jgi:DNA-binding transcriptional LysR family regulator
MELRQLRYFVVLAEELHFGRAAAREHIVQSALSQQVQRLERELGVRLLERSTHHVALTAAGAAFLAEAQQILAHVDRAAHVARSATGASPALRVGIIDASYERARRRPGQGAVLLAEEARAPEFNRFTVEMCRSAGFTPTVYEGTVESIRAAADLVARGSCLYCVPSSCIASLPGTIWRPLAEPASYYPWSVLWRAAEVSDHVRAIVNCARIMSRRLGWLVPATQDG